MSKDSQSNSGIPVEVIAFTAIITSIFGLSIPNNYIGIPAYARISLFMIALNNLFPSLSQWLGLFRSTDDNNRQYDTQTMQILENHTSLAVVKVIVNSFQTKIGMERCYICLVYIIVVCYAPQLTFMILKLQLLRIICIEITNIIYRPFYYHGKYLNIEINIHQLPLHSFFVDISMVGIPLLYANWQGHI